MKLLIALMVVGVIFWLVTGNHTTPMSATQTASRASVQPACDVGQLGTGDVIAIVKDYELRALPSETADRIRNAKASDALKTTIYHQIDPSATVRHLCVDGDWSQVQIASPEWLTHVKGWAPSSVFRGIERTASGTRIYVESDFYWDADAGKYKPQIVSVVNKIAQEHDGCSTIDTGTVAKSADRSKANDPVFFVTCGTGASMFNVWFRPTDTDRAFKAPSAVGRGDAIIACEQAAKQAATHPSTVDFSRIMDVSFSARLDGRATLQSSFTAKNGFNLELKYNIRCLFEGNTLIESGIVEAG